MVNFPDPRLMHQLQEVCIFVYSSLLFIHQIQTQPEIAEAAQSNPARFAELLQQTRQRQIDADQEITALNADPFDVDAQRKIEEAIRQQAVMENMEHAIEYSPESFGRVTML
jgi:DNA damage-inducible protein 1